MKNYKFAPISAREYPTVKILDHPHIWGGVQFCVNLSEKPYSPELEEAMAVHGIEWIHCPVSEAPGAQWLDSFTIALSKMWQAYSEGKKQIVHCDLGNNRSKSLIEAFYYVLNEKQFEDEYKGEINHLVYNCKIGHLPPLDETESLIKALIPNVKEKEHIPLEEAKNNHLASPVSLLETQVGFDRHASISLATAVHKSKLAIQLLLDYLPENPTKERVLLETTRLGRMVQKGELPLTLDWE